MYVIFFVFTLILESLCMYYLPKETIINLPTDSNNGYIYLKDTDWPNNYYTLVFFRVTNGKMDPFIKYGYTDIIPSSDNEIPYMIRKENYRIDTNNESITYIFQMDPFQDYSNKYYIINYSGFSGTSLSAACTLTPKKARYLPKGKIILPFISEYEFLYIKYSDFPDTEDLYVYFEIENGRMDSTIEYQETNADPDFITTHDSPKKKESKIWNNDDALVKKYIFYFTKSDKNYLIILIHLYNKIDMIVSSSIKIKYVSPKDTLVLSPNYNYGYIYWRYDDFKTEDDIYIYFKISDGSMNTYIEYSDTSYEPEYEEKITSLKYKSYTREERKYGETIYGFEFPSIPTFYGYLVIKYSGFTGKSISVSSTTKIKYLSIDNKINLYKINFGYIYLNYKDFIDSDDKKYIYLYFESYNGEMHDKIYYINTDIYPVYKEQFTLINAKTSQKKDTSYHYDIQTYVYKFEKLDYNYIVIGYSGFNGNTLSVACLSINPIPSYLSKDKTLDLPRDSKSGFIYLKYGDFSNNKGIKDYYIYFQILNGRMDSNISYLNVDKNPESGQFYSSLKDYIWDNSNKNSEPKIYSYKFHRSHYSYLVIKYSGFNGNSINVTSSFDDSLANPPTLLIVFSVIGSVIIIAILAIVFYICFWKKRKRISKIEEILQPNNSDASNQILSPDSQENSPL